MVVVLLVVYFGFFSSASSTFLTSDNIANITWTVAPWAIIAIGEVFLLVCGELDLSVGFILGFSPFLMHYLIDFYGVPPLLAVLLCLLMGARRRLRQRVHHRHPRRALVHHHPRHRVHPPGRSCW